MEVTGTILFKKLRELFPDLLPSVTPEVLNKICDDPVVQPFLAWFCTQVTPDNILTEQDLLIKQHLEKSDSWLKQNIDSRLREAIEYCPELSELLESESICKVDHKINYEAEKERLAKDREHIDMIKESIRFLQEEEDRLMDEIEYEENQLEKDRLETEECYKDCIDRFRDLDDAYQVLDRGVEQLTNVYADAAESKRTPITWTQMPLELCKNQTKMYINYLAAYIKRNFGNGIEYNQTTESNSDAFMEDSRDKRGEEMLHDLSFCLRNLINAKIEEISSSVNAEACSAMEKIAVDIYNKDHPKIPQTEAELQLGIMEICGRRDFLEENVRLLREHQLVDAVTGWAESTIMNIVVQDARARKERRERRLVNMLRLRELAREHGHAHSDLLCMLMELQCRQIAEAFEFVADARYYLTTEYSLTSTREGILQELQAEYESLRTIPSKSNVYNKIFISMMNGDLSDKDAMTKTMDDYSSLVSANQEAKEIIFGLDLDEKFNEITALEAEVDKIYNREIADGPTATLNLLPLDIVTQIEEATEMNAELERSLLVRRNRMKEKLQKSLTNFEWEYSILWQRFLTEPDSLARIYEEAAVQAQELHIAKQQTDSTYH